MTDEPIADYHFLRGALRGTQFTLLESRLLHIGTDCTESTALEAIASVRIAYEHDARRIGWGVALGAIALVVFALAGPLDALAVRGLADIAAQIARDGAQASALAHFLESALGALKMLTGLMRVAGFALLAGGVVLVVLGWIGHTSLALVLPSTEREYRVPGRDTVLLEFAEDLAQTVAARMRR